MSPGNRPELPAAALLEAQSAALAPMRSRLLRRVGIGHRGPILDLGAGRGAVTAELVRRSRGPVVAFDRHADALEGSPAHEAHVGEAESLPFDEGAFELVFAQCFFLWNEVAKRARIIDELWRVLAPGGALLAIEPDWGAAMEHPDPVAVAEVATRALGRAGADPRVGRRLPGELRVRGFDVRVELAPEVGPPDGSRFDLIQGLPLDEAERAAVARARAAQEALPEAELLVHVPVVFITATRR